MVLSENYKEHKMIKDLAKNLANFCGKPPLIDPSKADCDDDSILWESYLIAWIRNWKTQH